MLCNRVFFFLYILIFMRACENCLCFDVNFREFHGAQIEPFSRRMQKRQMAQFYDKAGYSFNGFARLESVPVPFPIDICVMQLESVRYATALHKQKDGVRHFAVYKYMHDNYVQIYDIATPNARAMDCKALGAKGYIAIAYNLTSTVERAHAGSPVFELTADRLRAVQYFATPHLYEVHLRVSGSDLFLLQTFDNTEATPHLHCPYYKWSGVTFTRLGRIPCSNARHVEPFSINYEIYVAVANYADQRGRTSTFSEIYKFSREQKKFQLFQKIKTYGAVDVRYFSVPYDEVERRRFLIFGNSLNRNGDKDAEAESVFYILDKGQFVPYQRLSLYAVEQFLPVQNTDAEKFLLLVAASEQDTKIYNLNDWKFEPSDVQFTEGALGKGVDNMRIYVENDNSYLVIANDNMLENETNIFRPIYKQDEHANALRQQIIDWAKTQLQRLAHIEVDQLKLNVEQKLLRNPSRKINMQVQHINNVNIQSANTGSFDYPKMHLTGSYWNVLSDANRALDALVDELQTYAPRAKRKISAQNANATDEQHSQQSADATTYTSIKVDTLVLREQLQARQVNGINTTNPVFQRISAKKVRVTDKFTDASAPIVTDAIDVPLAAAPSIVPTLKVETLEISDKLNGYSWQQLLNETLKRSGGVQFIKQPAHIDSLHAESVMVTQDEIAGHALHKLVPTDGGSYNIQQNVHFAAPVHVRNMQIKTRLNGIKVQHGKLDVLLKRNNESQLVTGTKRFDNVRVLQPIAVAGQLLGARLQLMAPHQLIHEDLLLHGHFSINGDAIVLDHLSAADLIARSGSNVSVSVKETLAHALSLRETLEDVNVRFLQPIEANNTRLSFVNARDLQLLIKTNNDELQVLEGAKLFPNTLTIRDGFSEVKFLNNIDVEQLAQRLLLKSANQTIRVPMHFGKIIAPAISTTNVTLADKALDVYLSRSGAQHIAATLRVERLTAKTAAFQQLHSNGYLFDAHLGRLRQEQLISARAANDAADMLQPHRKFPGTIFVGNLRTNASINGRAVHDIERQMRQLSSDIRFVGNYKFNHNMNISRLSFQGSLNGIMAPEFGHSWLQKTGAQRFTAPQTFARVHCAGGLLLDGALNGYQVADYLMNTYWLDRDEHISDVVFQNPIQLQAAMRTGTLNGVHVPLDMLYSNTTQPQLLYASAYVHENLNVLGAGIFNVSTVNGLHLMALEEFLINGYGYETLHVEHAYFEQPPYYQTLNRHNMQQLLENVWLTNEHVNLNQHVELAEATFEGLLDFKGLVNNHNLYYLKENYLSLSRPQEVHTELIISGDVKFDADLTINNLRLRGPLVETTSNTPLNFDEFVANTLKTSGPHEIRAVWSLQSAHVQGDLSNVQVNNLNLARDVLRLDMPYAEITAPKRLHGLAVIKKLYATPSSTINGVPLTSWLRDTVYVHENRTVHGTTTVDNINLYGELRVRGNVNNLTHFDEQTLLLRDAPLTLHGNVRIRNLFPATQRVLVNNIENLRAETVNGQNVEEFYAKRAQLAPNVAVQGNLVFVQPLVVQEYHNDEYELARKSRSHMTPPPPPPPTSSGELYSSLLAHVQQLRAALQAPHYMLDHFEVRQVLPSSNATRLVPLMISAENGGPLQQILAVVGGNSVQQSIEYYKWSVKEQRFVSYPNLTWLPQDDILLELISASGADARSTIEAAQMKAQLYQRPPTNGTTDFKKLLGTKRQHIAIRIAGKLCLLVEASLFCLHNGKMQKSYTFPQDNIKQLLPLSATSAALLLNDTIEIWSLNVNAGTFRVLQRITLLQPQQLAVGYLNNITYLAVITSVNGSRNSLQSASTVDIYSSSADGANYRKMQSLICLSPIQLAFSTLPQMQDLLLHVLSASEAQPLQIYQYKGVMGFEKIVGVTTLPTAQRMQIVAVDSQQQQRQMIALMSVKRITFVEIVLKKL